MDKSKVVSSVIIAVSLIISSLILSYGMSKLGVDIKDAGIYSANVKLQNNRPLRITIDDGQ